MDGSVVLHTNKCGVGDRRTKGEKMVKGTSIGGAPRKTLADISNLPQRPKPTSLVEKEQSVPLTTVQYIEQLRKENMTLLKLLADRNRIIELSQIELNRLRINLQKVQEQNLHLAQANTQMLGEINSGKDTLKILRHELGCKSSLLTARNIDSKEKAKTAKCQITRSQAGTVMCDEAGVSSQADERTNSETCTNRRRQSKNKSWAPSDTKSEQDRGDAENKRPCLRRRSARLKKHEDRLEMDDSKFPVSPLRDDPIDESDTSTLGLSVKKEHEANNDPSVGAQEFQRSSMGRPLRRAVEKVQSYKEIPLNVKMRRSC